MCSYCVQNIHCCYRSYVKCFVIMANFSTEQRVFIVKNYLESHSYVEVRLLFSLEFPDRNPPSKMGIWKNVKKYLNEGTSLNLNSKKCGRKQTGRSDENIDAELDALINNPNGFSCRINDLDIPHVTINRIVRIDLKWHPYRIQRRHELKAGDYARQVQFCECFLQKNRARQWLSSFVIGDEAGFWMNGRVSSQNVRKYAPKGNSPEFTYEVSANKENCMAWMGLCGNGDSDLFSLKVT